MKVHEGQYGVHNTMLKNKVKNFEDEKKTEEKKTENKKTRKMDMSLVHSPNIMDTLGVSFWCR